MRVLVCTDFSAASAAGEREAVRRFPDATLVLVHVVDRRFLQAVVDRTGTDPARLHDDALAYADQRLSEIAERVQSQGRRSSAELLEGDPVAAVLASAGRHRVELIVVGVAPGERGGRFRTQLALRSRLPVLLVPGE